MTEFKKQKEESEKKAKPNRYFCKDDQLIQANNRTYALSKMWGLRTAEVMKLLTKKWNELPIEFNESEED